MSDDVPIGSVSVENDVPQTRRDASYDYVLVHVDKSNKYISYKTYYEGPPPLPASNGAVGNDGPETTNNDGVENGVGVGSWSKSDDAAAIRHFLEDAGRLQ